MKSFLVQAIITKTEYMADQDQLFDDTRMVIADTKDSVMIIYNNYWIDHKSEEYSVSYYVNNVSITETLTQGEGFPS